MSTKYKPLNDFLPQLALMNKNIMTQTETQQLVRRAQQGDIDAMQRVIEGNLRLVSTVIRNRFQPYLNTRTRSMDIHDLFGEGVLGLHRAVEGYDTYGPHKFSTYACNWIFAFIRRAITRRDRLIRLPENKAYDVWHTSNSNDSTIDDIIAQRGYAHIDSSLDAPVASSDSDATIMDFVADDADTEREAIGNHSRDQIAAALAAGVKGLSKREYSVLKLRFGLDGEEPRSLRLTGEAVGGTYEAVRLAQKRAIKKIKPYLSQCAA